MVISDYFKKLADDDKVAFRNRVLVETGMSYSTFYYKVRHGNWTKSEETIISSIIDSFGHAE